MFTFGYSHTPPYITYRVISKDGFMHDPVPITISDPIMMHDFAITENYAIFMDLPLYFRPKVWHLKLVAATNVNLVQITMILNK
jgi:carotenoid cleavage dioxygenase-like enzyme